MLRAYCSDWEGDQKMPVLSPEETHHLVRVRRVRKDETVEILNGRGDVMTCKVQHASGKELQLGLGSLVRTEKELLHRHLLVALPKGKTFSSILQKAVELGVGEITPLVTENSEVASNKADRKADRWEAVLIEALKQSGNPWLPKLNPPATLQTSIATTIADELRICAALQPDALPLMEVLKDYCPMKGKVDVYVGPEGDFSAKEYRMLQDAGCRFVTLGPLVMKVETAASLAIGVIGMWARTGSI